MNNRKNKTQELDDQIKRLALECKLSSWMDFVDDVRVPSDLYPALASGRPELINLISPRALSADEAKSLFGIIASLVRTNTALRDHAQQLAHFASQWADAFKHLQSVGHRIERFANFEHGDHDDDDNN